MDEQVEKVYCGQIRKLVNAEKYYNIGSVGELIIVLSRDKELWNIGCFWFGHGARQREFNESEIEEISVPVGDIFTISKSPAALVPLDKKLISDCIKSAAIEILAPSYSFYNPDDWPVKFKDFYLKMYENIMEATSKFGTPSINKELYEALEGLVKYCEHSSDSVWAVRLYKTVKQALQKAKPLTSKDGE